MIKLFYGEEKSFGKQSINFSIICSQYLNTFDVGAHWYHVLDDIVMEDNYEDFFYNYNLPLYQAPYNLTTKLLCEIFTFCHSILLYYILLTLNSVRKRLIFIKVSTINVLFAQIEVHRFKSQGWFKRNKNQEKKY